MSSEGLASRDGKCGDENFPRDVERAPELGVVDAQGARVAPQAVDGHCVREKGLRAMARCELAGKLVKEGEDALARGIITVQWVRRWAGQERREQVVDPLGV